VIDGAKNVRNMQWVYPGYFANVKRQASHDRSRGDATATNFAAKFDD